MRPKLSWPGALTPPVLDLRPARRIVGGYKQRRHDIMLNKIKAALGRLWRPRRRRDAERGFYDQRAAGQHRSQQVIEQSRGEDYTHGGLG